ncbi:MAG: serine/threonine-protein kinase [bacterium]
MDRDRWQSIEPLLDVVLDLPADARTDWIASLHAREPELADDLTALLADGYAADERGFLARPVEVALAGLEIGGYTLQRLLGHGGMGSVWLGRRTDDGSDDEAAVKLLNLSLASGAGHARFRREGSMLARLTHPGIARLLDAGVSEAGQPYLALEYVNGDPIDVYADRQHLSIEERVRLIVRVLDAVGHAHANLIIHRDLKPSNILVTADGTVKLLDFGIGKLLDGDEGGAAVALTLEGGRLFTPEYAAPEQVFGDAITTATDVYAIGVLLYILVSGSHPTASDCQTREAVIRALREVQPAKVGSGDLSVVLNKALRKDGEERYQTAAALAGDLELWLAHKPVSARAPSLAYRTRKFARRNRTALAGAGAVAVLLLAYTITVTVDRERLAHALDEATTSARRADRVADFTVRLFEPSAEGTALTDSVSARELLARTVAHAREFAGQPLIEAQLLDLIGRIRTTVGAYAEARPVLEEALALREQALGPDHPDVATSLVDLAALMSAVEAEDKAIPLLQRALAMRTRAFGARDSRTADALFALASAMHVSGDYRGAKPLFERWFSIIQGEPPQVTPARAQQLSDFAEMLAISGQYERAEALTRNALALERELYGPTHFRVATELSRLGAILADRNLHAAADSSLRQAVSLLRANFPNGHVELANALRNQGYFLSETQKWTEAEATWREAANLYHRAEGDDGLGYANALVQVGRTQVARNEYVAAERTLRQALRLGGAVRPPTNPIATRGRIYLGEALRGEGRLPEAETLLLSGYRERTLGRGVREYAANALRKLYEAQGRTTEAMKYRNLPSP